MPQSPLTAFKVVVPDLPTMLDVCEKWINKRRGTLISVDKLDCKYTMVINTAKKQFQNNLQRSLRTYIKKNGFGVVEKDFHVYEIKKPRADVIKELTARVKQLEAALAHSTLDDATEETDDEADDETDSDDESSDDDDESSNASEDVSEDAANDATEVIIEIKPKRRAIPAYIRQLVWNKNCGENNGVARCWCCDVAKIDKASGWDCGHVVSLVRGGSDDIANLRPICRGCNGAMGAEHMLEFQRRHFPQRHEALFPLSR